MPLPRQHTLPLWSPPAREFLHSAHDCHRPQPRRIERAISWRAIDFRIRRAFLRPSGAGMSPDRFHRAYALGHFPAPLTGLEIRRTRTAASRRARHRGAGLAENVETPGAGRARPLHGAISSGSNRRRRSEPDNRRRQAGRPAPLKTGSVRRPEIHEAAGEGGGSPKKAGHKLRWPATQSGIAATHPNSRDPAAGASRPEERRQGRRRGRPGGPLHGRHRRNAFKFPRPGGESEPAGRTPARTPALLRAGAPY